MRQGKVITAIPGGYKRIIKKMMSNKIVCFENSFEEIALKYVPGEPGKYYAKYYGSNEYEIAHSSKVVCEGLLEGRIIRKTKYENYNILRYY